MDKPLNRRDLLKAGAVVGAAAAAAGSLTPETAQAGPAAPGAPGPRLVLRPSLERGTGDYGWLKARYSFSFARYHDPRNMGFRGLRVMNEDVIQAGGGFPMHPHQDMEIITYVLEGALQHRDNMGNGSVIRPGEVQRMSAGTGIFHSEFNPSKRDRTHLLQIWILPTKRRIQPSWSQETFPMTQRQDRLRLVASPTGAGGSLPINADANLYASVLRPQRPVVHATPRGRHTWIQVARGDLQVNGVRLAQGDGVRTSDPGKLTLVTERGAEILLFDLS